MRFKKIAAGILAVSMLASSALTPELTGITGSLAVKASAEEADGTETTTDTANEKTDETDGKTDETDDKTDETDDKTDETDNKTDETDDKTDETDDKTDETDDKTDETDDKKDETDDKKEEEEPIDVRFTATLKDAAGNIIPINNDDFSAMSLPDGTYTLDYKYDCDAYALEYEAVGSVNCSFFDEDNSSIPDGLDIMSDDTLMIKKTNPSLDISDVKLYVTGVKGVKGASDTYIYSFTNHYGPTFDWQDQCYLGGYGDYWKLNVGNGNANGGTFVPEQFSRITKVEIVFTCSKMVADAPEYLASNSKVILSGISVKNFSNCKANADEPDILYTIGSCLGVYGPSEDYVDTFLFADYTKSAPLISFTMKYPTQKEAASKKVTITDASGKSYSVFDNGGYPAFGAFPDGRYTIDIKTSKNGGKVKFNCSQGREVSFFEGDGRSIPQELQISTDDKLVIDTSNTPVKVTGAKLNVIGVKGVYGTPHKYTYNFTNHVAAPYDWSTQRYDGSGDYWVLQTYAGIVPDGSFRPNQFSEITYVEVVIECEKEVSDPGAFEAYGLSEWGEMIDFTATNFDNAELMFINGSISHNFFSCIGNCLNLWGKGTSDSSGWISYRGKNATIKGAVNLPTGDDANALIELKDENGNIYTVKAEDGSFSVEGLEDGVYTLNVNKDKNTGKVRSVVNGGREVAFIAEEYGSIPEGLEIEADDILIIDASKCPKKITNAKLSVIGTKKGTSASSTYTYYFTNHTDALCDTATQTTDASGSYWALRAYAGNAPVWGFSPSQFAEITTINVILDVEENVTDADIFEDYGVTLWGYMLENVYVTNFANVTWGNILYAIGNCFGIWGNEESAVTLWASYVDKTPDEKEAVKSKFCPRNTTIKISGGQVTGKSGASLDLSAGLDMSLQQYGDADGDGEINIKDALQIVNYRNSKPSSFDKASGDDLDYLLAIADINGDGVVNILDALQIVNFRNGKKSAFDDLV